jgi:sulfonate transport system ATP-binding protein
VIVTTKPQVTSIDTPMGVAVIARDVQRTFNGRDVLHDVNLTVEADQFVALLGRSGTGKSTLLRILGGLDPDYEGQVLVPERRAVVFQEARLVPWLRVLSNVLLGLGSGEENRAALRERGLEALDEVGLAQHAKDWPLTLSGGEAQRVALARALVREPQLMLLDEPFGALDALTRIKMHALLQRLCARHHPAVLLVTHDVDEAILLADRIVVLVDGAIAFDAEVNISKPRNRGDANFLALRTRLLGELGVDESAPTPPVPSPHLVRPGSAMPDAFALGGELRPDDFDNKEIFQ